MQFIHRGYACGTEQTLEGWETRVLIEGCWQVVSAGRQDARDADADLDQFLDCTENERMAAV